MRGRWRRGTTIAPLSPFCRRRAADPLDLSASVSSSASICHRCEEASAANLDVKADEEEAWVRYSDMNKDWVLSDGVSI